MADMHDQESSKLQNVPAASQDQAKRKRVEDSEDSLGQPPKQQSFKDSRIDHWLQNNHQWPVEDDKLTPLGKYDFTLIPPSADALHTNYHNYESWRHLEILTENGIYMTEHELGVAEESVSEFSRLFTFDAPLPIGTIFDNHAFDLTCKRLTTMNATGLTRRISDLLVPSAEAAVDLGYFAFEHLTVSINERWTHSLPLCIPQPQPDYAVGFAQSAFTTEQYEKLELICGEYEDASYVKGTSYMFFPFLVCEVRGSDESLDIAARNNAHNAALCVRGVVELFKALQRELEINRVILAVSIAHDNAKVEIHGHYAVIGDSKTTYHRTTLREFYFTNPDGSERWTCYRFVMALYADWAPGHFARIASVVDELLLASSSEYSSELEDESDA